MTIEWYEAVLEVFFVFQLKATSNAFMVRRRHSCRADCMLILNLSVEDALVSRIDYTISRWNANHDATCFTLPWISSFPKEHQSSSISGIVHACKWRVQLTWRIVSQVTYYFAIRCRLLGARQFDDWRRNCTWGRAIHVLPAPLWGAHYSFPYASWWLCYCWTHTWMFAYMDVNTWWGLPKDCQPLEFNVELISRHIIQLWQIVPCCWS